MIADLCKKINLPPEETQLVLQTLKKHGTLCEKLAHRIYKKGNFGLLKKMTLLNRQQGGLISLCVVLLMAEFTKLAYQRRGISMEIYYATMGDITIWSKNFRRQYGVPGLDETNWLIHHIQLRLFRLGRLQFMRRQVFFPLTVPRKKTKALPFHRGDPCVDVHIPAGEPLTTDMCLASFRQADEFFGTYFPEHRFAYYTCSSWLLSPYNREMLPAESNIIRFSELWRIPFSWDGADAAIESIFGKEQAAKRVFSEETSLQRSAKARLQEGKPLGEGFGYRPRKGEEEK